MTSPIPSPGAFGNVGDAGYRYFQSLSRAAASLDAGKASVTQTVTIPAFIEFPEAKDYRIIINSPVAFSITSVTTRSSTGTATLTVKINSTALGGTANSVSTSEQTQTHSSANAVAAGDDIVLTFSSVSSPEDVAVMITGSITLA